MGGRIEIDGDNARHGLTALVLALVEVIHAALKLQAVRRMDNGTLAGADLERVGAALMAVEQGLAELKRDLGLADAVSAVRGDLDGLVRQLLEPELQIGDR